MSCNQHASIKLCLTLNIIGSNCSGAVREFIALHRIPEDLYTVFFYGSGGGPDIYNNFGHAPAGQVA